MGLDLGKLIKGVAQDVGHKIEKAANGAAHAVENAVKDTVHAAGTAVGELSKLPVHVQDTISTLTKKRKKPPSR